MCSCGGAGEGDAFTLSEDNTVTDGGSRFEFMDIFFLLISFHLLCISLEFQKNVKKIAFN